MCCLGSMQLLYSNSRREYDKIAFCLQCFLMQPKKAAKIAYFELGKKSDKWVVMGQFITSIFWVDTTFSSRAKKELLLRVIEQCTASFGCGFHTNRADKPCY